MRTNLLFLKGEWGRGKESDSCGHFTMVIMAVLYVFSKLQLLNLLCSTTELFPKISHQVFLKLFLI